MKMIQKKVYIHAGPGKTGSSAIQLWLNENAKLLAEKGVLYPKHESDVNGVSSGNREAILKSDGKGGWYVCEKKVKSILEFLDKSECHTLFLSSEFFYRYIADIAACIPNVEFIIYIRNPLELMESNYNQGIKRHGFTHKFKAPKSLENQLWSGLSEIIKKVGSERLHFKPYSKKFFYNGSIVSDILNIINLDFKIENKNINPSFTFPALEFKRLLNCFNLNDMSGDLDRVLQSYQGGEASYSLLPPVKFKSLRADVLKGMLSFINEFDRKDLLPLYEEFKETKQKIYLKQSVSEDIVSSVVEFLRDKDLSLFKKLKKKIEANNNLLVDEVIFHVFGVEPERFVIDIEEDFLSKTECLEGLPGKRGRTLYNIGVFYLEKMDYKNAMLFLKSAHVLFPNNNQFKQTLNELIVLINSEDSVSRNKKSFLKDFWRGDS